MSKIQSLTEANFAETITTSEKPVLVDFWAEWCGPCRAVAPVLDELADDFSDSLTIAKVNVDENPGVAQQFSVMGIPTFIIFDGGQPVSVFKGAMSKTAFVHQIASVID